MPPYAIYDTTDLKIDKLIRVSRWYAPPNVDPEREAYEEIGLRTAAELERELERRTKNLELKAQLQEEVASLIAKIKEVLAKP